MFNLGGGEILVILFLALIVLGPDKLPDAARKVGTMMGELRRLSSGFQAELRDAIAEPDIKPIPRAVEQATTAAAVIPVAAEPDAADAADTAETADGDPVAETPPPAGDGDADARAS